MFYNHPIHVSFDNVCQFCDILFQTYKALFYSEPQILFSIELNMPQLILSTLNYALIIPIMYSITLELFSNYHILSNTKNHASVLKHTYEDTQSNLFFDFVYNV